MKKIIITAILLLITSFVSAMEEFDANDMALAAALSLSIKDSRTGGTAPVQENNDALIAQVLQEEENRTHSLMSSASSVPSASASGTAGNDEAASRALAQKLHEKEVAGASAQRKTSQPNITSIVFPANKQLGATCGYHATINAKAIQDLQNAGEPITASNIQKQAKTYFKYISGTQSIDSEEIITLARRIGLDKDMLCFFYRDGVTIKPAYQRSEAQQTVATLLRNIKQQKSAIAHCICHIGAKMEGHWFVISIVKEAGNPTRLICLDSANGQTGPRSPAHAYFEYIKSVM